MTANEMFDLVECVRRAESPFAEVNADAIGFPVKVCEGVYSFSACSSIQSN